MICTNCMGYIVEGGGSSESFAAKRHGYPQTPNEDDAGKQSPSLDSHYFPLNRAFLHKSLIV
jgi:hypothetical protein